MRNPFRSTKSSVLVPFVPPKRPEVVEALAKHRPLWVDVSGDDDAYWRLLRSAFNTGQTFIVVEHDNVPHDGALEELMACPNQLCTFPYLVNGSVQPALGCTKFGGLITQAFPGFMDIIGGYSRHWASLDTYIYLALQARGYMPCIHEPAIKHLHPNAEVFTANPTLTLTINPEAD